MKLRLAAVVGGVSLLLLARLRPDLFSAITQRDMPARPARASANSVSLSLPREPPHRVEARAHEASQCVTSRHVTVRPATCTALLFLPMLS